MLFPVFPHFNLLDMFAEQGLESAEEWMLTYWLLSKKNSNYLTPLKQLETEAVKKSNRTKTQQARGHNLYFV